MMELELLILEFWSFKTAYVDKFSTWNYKLELQKLDFSTIKISKFQTLSNTVSKTQNTHLDTHSHTQTLSSFRHPNPHSTKDAPLIGGKKTLSHSLSLRTKSVNLTLLSKSRLSLPFCQNPSLFVSIQHPRLIYIPLTKVQIFSVYRYLCLSVTPYRAPKFQFLSYVFSFLRSFIVGRNFFVFFFLVSLHPFQFIVDSTEYYVSLVYVFWDFFFNVIVFMLCDFVYKFVVFLVILFSWFFVIVMFQFVMS